MVALLHDNVNNFLADCDLFYASRSCLAMVGKISNYISHIIFYLSILTNNGAYKTKMVTIQNLFVPDLHHFHDIYHESTHHIFRPSPTFLNTLDSRVSLRSSCLVLILLVSLIRILFLRGRHCHLQSTYIM